MMNARAIFTATLLAALTVPLIPCAADQTQCEARLKEVYRALRSYARENDGRLPLALSALYYEAFLDRLDVFTCPDSGKAISLRTEIDALTDFQLAAERLPAQGRVPILRETGARHSGQALVLYFDGSIGLGSAPLAAPRTEEPDQPRPTPPVVVPPVTPLGPETPARQEPPAGTLKVRPVVFATQVIDGQPSGAATRFTEPKQVVAWAPYWNLPPDTILTCTWSHNGRKVLQQKEEGAGDGAIWFIVAVAGGAVMPEGEYGASISAGGEPLATGTFQVGQGAQVETARTEDRTDGQQATDGKGTVMGGYLGVLVRSAALPTGRQYLSVAAVLPGTPAEGVLQASDLILKVAGTTVGAVSALRSLLQGLPPESAFDAEIMRGGRKQTVRLTAGHRPPGERAPVPVLGRFTGEVYSGQFLAALDPAARWVGGSLWGTGIGIIEGPFEGDRAEKDGFVVLQMNATVMLLNQTSEISGTIRGTIREDGSGEGKWDGEGILGTESGAWQCEPSKAADIGVL